MGILFMRLGLGAVIVLPFYIVLRLLYVRKKKQKPEYVREFLLAVFVLFMAGLIVLVLWPRDLDGANTDYVSQAMERLKTGIGTNFVPLRTIRSYFARGFSSQFIINIIANVLMFSPMGFFLPLLWQRYRKWWKLLLIGTVFSVGIETVQLFVGRSVDVDDVILNVAGVMLGYAACHVLAGIMPKVKADRPEKRTRGSRISGK